MKNKDDILIYAEHVDAKGLRHYGVDIYNSCTGCMTYFSDLFDTDCLNGTNNERNNC